MSSKKVLVSCCVIALRDTGFVYPCCKLCLSRSIEEADLRSRCVKCGFTCEVQNVDYRYRLSLKVSRGRNIFGVTVFGGCLNSFFGITAGDLQRFVDSNKPEGPQSLQQLLIKAVEDCFIGKSFVFGFKLSGVGAEGCLLDDSLVVSAESAQFVACQIISPNGVFLGMTVFAYLQSLLQANSLPRRSASNEAICHLQQTDSLVNSFEYTLPLCVKPYSEASGVGLAQLWQETSGLDSYFSPKNSSGHSLQQITLDGVEHIPSQNIRAPWPKLEPGWPTKGLSMLSQSQIGQVKSTGGVHYAANTSHSISTSKYVESKGGAGNRRSSLLEFSSTSPLVGNKLDSPVAMTSSIACESLDRMKSNVYNHRSSQELAGTQCNASFLGKSHFSHYSNFSLEDAPLSESLGSFLSTEPHVSKVEVLKPAYRCSKQREQATPKRTNCVVTPLNNITNVITRRHERTLKIMHRKRRLLSLSKSCLPGTPRVSRVSEDSDINDMTSKSLTKRPAHMAFRLQHDQRDKDIIQVDPAVCPKIRGMKEQGSPSGSHRDEYNCSSDMFYQSSADITATDCKEIKKDWLLDMNASEHEASTSFHFAPSLQSTPIAHPCYDRTHGRRRMLGRECSDSPCTKKEMTLITSIRVHGNHINTIRESKAIKPVLDKMQGSEFVSENSDFASESFGHLADASRVQKDEEHDSALATNTNEWSRDLFSNSL